jgi:16S rRNA processing protein RimM
MGRIGAPFGVKGWVKIQPFTETADGLRHYPTWWLGGAGHWREYTVEHTQPQGAALAAKLAGCDDRDAAAGFKGRVVAVPRDAFPREKDGEFYWSDLIGLNVKNCDGLDFGTVEAMLETGANDVLVVRSTDEHETERLIPFIAKVVKKVDPAAGVIEVDWGADF